MTDLIVLALSGGVGGAKLALGLSKILAPENLTIVTNTADDFNHLGFRVCPDTDTILYTLSGLADDTRGWGRKGETWNFMSAIRHLGGEDWFNLGDRDLALHVYRTQAIQSGVTLSEVTSNLTKILGLNMAILPMTDDRVETIVETTNGPLPFQHYFVRERCKPSVTGFRFQGIEDAKPQPKFIKKLTNKNIDCLIVTPSNPFVSIDPILSLEGVRDKIVSLSVPTIAISPIVGGEAIKGPAAKMMSELGIPSTAFEVARHYSDILDGFIIDHADAAQANNIEALNIKVLITNTIMNNLLDRKLLAQECCNFVKDLMA